MIVLAVSPNGVSLKVKKKYPPVGIYKNINKGKKIIPTKEKYQHERVWVFCIKWGG
ncbi:MAG: hypothetical protein QXD03_04410 [Candidatus Anstonellales archaeon]